MKKTLRQGLSRRGRSFARPAGIVRIIRTALAVCVCLAAATSTLAQPTIGLYRDTSGSNCSLTDTQPGFIDAYVVVRPSAEGVRAVQFSAPVPPCFTGMYVADAQAPGTLVVGNSQSGISVALQFCQGAPVHVLTVRYFGYGTTPACCEYPILPDPTQSSIQFVDCTFTTTTAAGTVALVNANGTCLCGTNTPPIAPFNPSPPDAATGVSVFTSLSWEAQDTDDNIAEYDVYLGTNSPPPLVATRSNPDYTPSPQPLPELTPHYWRVVVRDSAGAETSGSVWTFTTRATNSPPGPPHSPSPGDGVTDIPISLALEWYAMDIDGDALVYDVYFGTSPTPPLVAQDASSNEYSVDSLGFETVYHWRIVARDPAGLETSGAVWSFTTRPPNYPPNAPHSPTPASGAQDQPLQTTLGWAAADPDGDALKFDVYFGPVNPPPLAAVDVAGPTYTPAGLEYSSTYWWRIVARDPAGAETTGPAWSLTTRPANYPPNPPGNPVPSHNATGRPIILSLAWQCTDPDGQALTYDVYFGPSSPPPLAASGVAQASFAPEPLAFLTTYRWRIVARDPAGAETSGPTWAFTTRANSAPNAPAGPSPASGATDRPITTVLAWQCTDPDGQPLVYDVYFGTSSTPPLAASDVASKTFHPGPLTLATLYRWRIVARDPLGAQRSGPTWNFITIGNTVSAQPSLPSPADMGVGSLSPVLSWVGFDPDAQTLVYDVYFGTTTSPPLVASGLSARMFAPGTLQRGVRYYWRVVVSDGLTPVSGPRWSFTAVEPGDVNQDGQVTMVDASCALEAYLREGRVAPACGGDLGALIADVGCNGVVTPADARCIRQKLTLGSCTFCVEGTTAGTAAVISAGRVWMRNDTLHVTLKAADTRLASFGFMVHAPSKLKIVEVAAPGPSFDALAASVAGPGLARIAGYSIAPQSVTTATEFIELRFAPAGVAQGGLLIDEFADDLGGAAPAQVSYGALLDAAAPPTDVVLLQNHPNPFNPQTNIGYELPARAAPQRVCLRIFDVAGRVVITLVDTYQTAGAYEARWDGRDDRGEGISSGIYFSVLDVDGQRRVQKLVLLK